MHGDRAGADEEAPISAETALRATAPHCAARASPAGAVVVTATAVCVTHMHLRQRGASDSARQAANRTSTSARAVQDACLRGKVSPASAECAGGDSDANHEARRDASRKSQNRTRRATHESRSTPTTKR